MTKTSTPVAPVALTPAERTARNKRVKEQDAALKAWQKAGSKGDRPETPDLDALNEQHAAGKKTKVTKANGKDPRPRMTEADIKTAILNVWKDDPTVSPSRMIHVFREKGLHVRGGLVRRTAQAMVAESGGPTPTKRAPKAEKPVKEPRAPKTPKASKEPAAPKTTRAAAPASTEKKATPHPKPSGKTVGKPILSPEAQAKAEAHIETLRTPKSRKSAA